MIQKFDRYLKSALEAILETQSSFTHQKNVSSKKLKWGSENQA